MVKWYLVLHTRNILVRLCFNNRPRKTFAYISFCVGDESNKSSVFAKIPEWAVTDLLIFYGTHLVRPSLQLNIFLIFSRCSWLWNPLLSIAKTGTLRSCFTSRSEDFRGRIGGFFARITLTCENTRRRSFSMTVHCFIFFTWKHVARYVRSARWKLNRLRRPSSLRWIRDIRRIIEWVNLSSSSREEDLLFRCVRNGLYFLIAGEDFARFFPFENIQRSHGIKIEIKSSF